RCWRKNRSRPMATFVRRWTATSAAAERMCGLSERSWRHRDREADMHTSVKTSRFSRRAVLKGGALTVGFALAGFPKFAVAQGAAGAKRVLDTKEVDAFLAVNGDGTVTVFCGKVDLGQGLRIAIPQIAAEELGIGIDKIKYVEGDTAITPDQGRTSGST